MINNKIILICFFSISNVSHAANISEKEKIGSISKFISLNENLPLIKNVKQAKNTGGDLKNDDTGATLIPKDESSYFHGNWLSEYKIEHFRNEGRSTNSRPVHEIVFADGRINFGDSGWNSGFLLKQVHFTNNPRDGSNNKTDFRMIEMEIRPAWSKSINKHWIMLEGIYLGKTGYEKNRTSGDNNNIGGDGYGFRPYYRYQFNDNFSINSDIKMLVEDKNARGANNGHFQYYEALINFGYKIADDVYAGLELFRKEGQDFNHEGDKISNVLEQEPRPWITWTVNKHQLLFKIEPQFRRFSSSGGYKETSRTQKYIFNYSYPVTDHFYFVAEYFYRIQSDKKFWDNNVRDTNNYDDTVTNFGKVGINYQF